MLLIYQEKFWFRANEPFRGLFGPKMTDSCNCRSVIKFMLKFCTMKESKRCMKAILFNFLKKKSGFRQMGYYGPNLETKMTDSSNLQDYFLNFAQWKWKTDKWRLFCWNFQKDSHLGANGPTWA